jgi:hypothetical protein
MWLFLLILAGGAWLAASTQLTIFRYTKHVYFVCKHQCGFRKGETKIDQIRSVGHIQEKTTEYVICTFRSFVYFKAACDTIRRNKLVEAVMEFKIPVNKSG